VTLEDTMLTYFEVEPHTCFPAHSHPGEQITTVTEGELFFELEGRTLAVTAGEAIAIPPGIVHAVFTGAHAARAFDAWSPPPRTYRACEES
jgi:quercetin dioxygenase-like cupin family protein